MKNKQIMSVWYIVTESLVSFLLCLSGNKEHREEYCRQEHCKPHCHAAGQLHDAGPP